MTGGYIPGIRVLESPLKYWPDFISSSPAEVSKVVDSNEVPTSHSGNGETVWDSGCEIAL
eukprot:scaffold38281_cov52-Attheya_sp.AAC.3